jgi:hypothetical protein
MNIKHSKELLFKRPKDWRSYYKALLSADAWWVNTYSGDPTYGVFRGDHTYVETIQAGRRVVTGDWSGFPRHEYCVALGLTDEDGYDYGLLGSMRPAGRAKQLFRSGTPKQLRSVYQILKPVLSAKAVHIASAARHACEELGAFRGSAWASVHDCWH